MSMGITIFNNSAGGGGGAAPSGVLFKTIEPSQYTSYRTGDVGDRIQTGFFDYTPPSNTAAVAELLGPAGLAALHDTDCSILVVDRQRLL